MGAQIRRITLHRDEILAKDVRQLLRENDKRFFPMLDKCGQCHYKPKDSEPMWYIEIPCQGPQYNWTMNVFVCSERCGAVYVLSWWHPLPGTDPEDIPTSG